ncbi:MAG: hypothetical protein K6F32_01375 [Bacilli bacterium]|nr:hypothetical protein [Bacilli bacterium]
MTELEYEKLLAEKEEIAAEIPVIEDQKKKAKARLERLEKAFSAPEISLEHAEAAVARLEDHAKKLAVIKESLNGVYGRYRNVKLAEESFKAFVKTLIGWFKKAAALADLNLFEEAKLALHKAKLEIDGADFGFEAKSIALAKEMLAHRKADLYARIAAPNLAANDKSLPLDELKEYMELAENLPTNYIDPADKPFHLSKALAFRLHDLALDSKQLSEPDLDMLDRLIALYDEHLDKADLCTDEVKKYAEEVRKEAIRHFNGLGAQAVEERSQEKAAKMLERKRPWLIDSIANPSIKDSETEADLPKNMLLEANAGMDSAEYKGVTDSLAAKPGDESYELLAALLAAKELEETKLNILMDSIKAWSLDDKVAMFALAIRDEVPAERLEMIYKSIFNTRPLRIDLVKRAEDLLLLRTSAPEKCKSRFESLLKGLLRSPRAKRIATKANDEHVHALYPHKKFKEPIGKPAKKTEVKSWSVGFMFFYVLLALIVPLALAAAGFYLCYLYDLSQYLTDFGIAAPLFLFLFPFIFFIGKRYGFDERGSQNARRVLTLFSIIAFGVSLVYFILPDTLEIIKGWAYALMVCGWSLLIFPSIAFREKKNFWKFGVFSFAVLVGIANVVFMVLRMTGVLA